MQKNSIPGIDVTYQLKFNLCAFYLNMVTAEAHPTNAKSGFGAIFVNTRCFPAIRMGSRYEISEVV